MITQYSLRITYFKFKIEYNNYGYYTNNKKTFLTFKVSKVISPFKQLMFQIHYDN